MTSGWLRFSINPGRTADGAMRITGAIFLLTLRSLARSRFLICILFLALALVALLPVAIQDDGTVTGRVQVLLRYTLAAVTFLLSVGTLGVAPGLVAGELETRHLQQVLVKPVRFGQIWAGKWLALVAVNAVMLALSMLLAQALLNWNLRASRLTPQQTAELSRTVLVSRVNRAPAPDAGGGVVRPGAERRWLFHHVPEKETGQPLTLRIQFITPNFEENRELDGEWSLGAPGKAPFFSKRLRVRTFLPQEIVIPPPPGPLPETLEAVYVNREPDAVLFHAEQGIRLLAPKGAYGPNLVRAYGLLLFNLALLAAVGLTMGSLFSSPVAVLAAFFALALFSFSGYIGSVARTGVFYVPHHHEDGGGAGHEEESEPGWAARHLEPLLKAAYRGADKVLAPVRRLDPLERVAGGERVSAAEVGRGFVVLIIFGSGLMAALAAGVFRRRETG
jgi:hypothetical protein